MYCTRRRRESLIAWLVSMPAISLSDEMANPFGFKWTSEIFLHTSCCVAVVIVDEKEVGWGGVAGRVRGHPNSKGGIKRQEVKWNPHTERRWEPWGAQWAFFLSHHTCLQEEMVMSPTSHFGTMVAGRKQQVEKGDGSREKEGRGCQRGWRSSLFYLPWILCFGPSAWAQ